MSSPDILYYHHDRVDLRGVAWLVAIVGLAVLAIALPIIHKHTSEPATLTIGVIAVAIWLTVLAVYGWHIRRARGRADTITIDGSGFVSHLFGRVDFSDIESHAVGRDVGLFRWERSAPSLRLTLADQRRLCFHLDARHYCEDLLDYVAFVDTVRARIKVLSDGASPAPLVLGCAVVFADSPADRQHAAKAATSEGDTVTHADVDQEPVPQASFNDTVSQRPDRASDDQTTARDDAQGATAGLMSRANQQADRRFKHQMTRHSKWAALAMMLLPLSYAIRSCDMSGLKSGPLDDVAEHAPAAFERSRNLIQRAVAEKGPVYLWSNTQEGTVKPVLVPNIKIHGIGIDSLDTMNTAGKVLDFIVNDEAEGYRMGVQHDATLSLSRYSKISLRPVEGEKILFFFLVPPKGVDTESRTGRALPDISWRVSYRNINNISQQIDLADRRLPMTLIARWSQMTPAPRIMVAASRYHGMTDAAFDAAVTQVKADFERRGIDTSNFETRRFDTGTVRQPDDDSNLRSTEGP
ncbi:hypothetical protein [Marinobacterium lutimaris]|uniref:Uncharacterized protein n=1 Tax=Marinobacterium lutimaris TaxID=568106 RepID=A0A1H6C4X2_9GAMM|nr:hypothetical protein [Marinobacterium lutimaris]SEG67406.1 hypothetical protein SAMN05444390_103131 [Marinobacterium lutimaris]